MAQGEEQFDTGGPLGAVQVHNGTFNIDSARIIEFLHR